MRLPPKLPNVRYRNGSEETGMAVAKRLRLSLDVTPCRSAGHNYQWTDELGGVRFSGWTCGDKRDGIGAALERLAEVERSAA